MSEQNNTSNQVKNKVFIAGLDYKTSERDLFHKLSTIGKVVSIRLVTEKETGKSRGFAFATFATEQDAQKAIELLNNTVFEGRRIGVKEAIDKK